MFKKVCTHYIFKMKKTKIVKIDSIESKSFICDFCGKKEKANSCYWWGGLNMIFDAGYGSNQDGINLVLDICDNCFKKKFGKFVKDDL